MTRSHSSLLRAVRFGGCALAAQCVLLTQTEESQAIYEWEGDESSAALFGSTKLFPTYSRTRALTTLPAENLWSAMGSFRLSLDASTHELLALEAAYHFFPIVSDGEPASAGLGGLGDGLVQPRASLLRVVDFDRRLVDEARFDVDHNLDRLNLLFMLGALDVRVGRQAVGHGSARIFTSTDIFSPFSPATLDNEFKQGLDALRVTIPLGETSELEAIAVGHSNHFADGIYLGHARHSFTGFDVSLYGGSSYRTPTFALDVSGDLLDATFYTEVFYRHWSRRNFERNVAPSPLLELPTRREHLLRATAGAHYYFEGGLTTIVEFHYNGAGAARAADYFEAALSPEWELGESFLLGRYYAALSLSYEVTELIRAGLTTLANVRDPSALLAPSVTWDSSDNTSVGLGGLVGLGRSIDELEPRSEYGLYPYTAYADARWYF